MKNFLVATINKQGQAFIGSDDNTYEPIANIPEHLSRLAELSENCHIYMDDLAFKAFGERTLPDRFTRVFVNHKDFDKNASQKFRLHHMDELDVIITRKEFYEKNTRVFFIGSPEFLEMSAKYCDTFLVTVVDYSPELEYRSHTLDLTHALKEQFLKRKRIKSEMMDIIKAAKKSLKTSSVEYAPNGMKIINTKLKNASDNPLTFIPDYEFYEFTRK